MPQKKVFLYALSTCGWCRKTKALLGELGAVYDFVDVDLLEGPDLERVREEVGRLNPRRSFPTLVIGDEVVVGFDAERIRSLLASE